MHSKFPRANQRALLFAVFLPMCAFQVRAGASLLVDDAAITPAGHCQVESWARVYSPGHELTAVPACNFYGTELGLGYSHFTQPQTTRLWNLGAKRLFRDVGTHPWGIGLSTGATWDSDVDRWVNWSVNVPASIALDPDRNVVVHANVGWNKPHRWHGTVTAGVGIEVALDAASTLLAELHDDHRGTTTSQLGVRRAVGDAATLDLLLGQDGISNSPWLTIGFNVTFPR